MMKAIRVNQVGGPEVLKLEELPIPEPRSEEALIKIEAIGVNFVDTKVRAGIDPAPLPITPGVEAAGIVEAIGADVTELKIGDRVAYVMHRGSYAEYASVPVHRIAQIPDDLSFLDAAGLMTTALTAHYMTNSAYPIREGDNVLIHACVGAVGSMLVQMAKLRGATIIGTTSNERKAQVAQELGADHTILYTKTHHLNNLTFTIFIIYIRNISTSRRPVIDSPSTRNPVFSIFISCYHRNDSISFYLITSGI